MTKKSKRGLWRSAKTCLGKKGHLSVIMPAFGLEDVIESNIEQVYSLLNGNIAFEILPVDDGSGDKTADSISRVAAKHPRVIHPVYVKTNRGKGNALKQGFAASTGSHILLLDADLDLSPERISTFFDVMLQEKAAIVIGSKRHPQSTINYPWHRRLASAVYYSLVYLLIGLPVSDTQTGMKLFRREALQWSFDRMLVKAFAFDLEVLSIAHSKGFKVAEAPILMQFGNKVGCLTWKNIKQVMVDTLAIFYRTRILKYYQSVEVPPEFKKPPLISVVIACPAPSAYLTECLNALELQSYPNFEVIVLPDESAEISAALNLQVIPTGKTRPAEKRNAGIAAARGEIVAFLDDDAYPERNWLKHAVKYFANPDVGGVGGPGETPPNDSFMAHAGGRVYANLLVSGNFRYRYVGDRVRSHVDDYPSCNLFVRTSLLRQIGGYRTDFWPGEDTILCSDIVSSGKLRIAYDPWAVVYHHRRPLFLPHLRQIGRYALHRGYFAKRFPATSLKLSYLIPSIFLIGLIVGIPLCFVHPVLKVLYLSTIAIYLLATLISSASVRPAMWMVTWLGVMATHLVYGARYLTGILARRMPCETAQFDHPSEKREKL
ncbi:MAG: glycosyltransferase [Kiritimatiellae bacterium]|nr:glycosyltransferase [Kiritimatiellia bacterium]